MWAASTSSPSPSCHRLTIPTRPTPSILVYAKSQPHKTGGENTTRNNSISINSIGHKILSAVNPKFPNPNRNQTTPKQESAAEISGSDVLRALQMAASVKEKRNTIRQVKEKKNESSIEEIGSDIRPLRIKSDWGSRLAELEKRFKEMADKV